MGLRARLSLVAPGVITRLAVGVAIGVAMLQAQPFNCMPPYSTNLIPMRRTGVTEQIGDLFVTCTGGTAGVVHDVNVTLSLSLPITSANPTGTKSDVLLLTNVNNEPEIGPGQNAFVGEFEPATAGSTLPHTVRFDGVKLSEGRTGTVMRIMNLRANVAAAAYGYSGPVHVMMDTSPRQPGFPMRFASGYLTPGKPNVTTRASQTPGYQMEVEIEETSPVDFRPRTYPGRTGFEFGMVQYAESGFTTTVFQSLGVSTAGLANSGTRILLRFSNVGLGQQVFVSTQPIASGYTPGLDARLLATDEGGGGAYVEAPATSATPSPGIAPVTIANGKGTAVYEITAVDTTRPKWAKFGVVLQGGTGTPTVDVIYGPLTTSTQTWIPRFAAPRTAPARVPTAVFRDTLNQVRLVEYGNPELYNAGGVFTGKPGVAQDSDGNTWIVSRDTHKGLYATRFDATTKKFDAWTFLGGAAQGDASVTIGADDGAMHYTIRDDWNACWVGTFRRGIGNTWQGMGGIFSSDPQVNWNPQGRLVLAGRDTWGGVWTSAIYTGAWVVLPWTHRGGWVQGPMSLSAVAPYTVLAARDPWNGLWFARIQEPQFQWIAGYGGIDRGPQLAGPAAIGAVADSIWTRQLDVAQGTPLVWTQTGGVLKSEAPAWVNNELYIVGPDWSGNIWWYRSSTGQWLKAAGQTVVMESEVSAAPR